MVIKTSVFTQANPESDNNEECPHGHGKLPVILTLTHASDSNTLPVGAAECNMSS